MHLAGESVFFLVRNILCNRKIDIECFRVPPVTKAALSLQWRFFTEKSKSFYRTHGKKEKRRRSKNATQGASDGQTLVLVELSGVLSVWLLTAKILLAIVGTNKRTLPVEWRRNEKRMPKISSSCVTLYFMLSVRTYAPSIIIIIIITVAVVSCVRCCCWWCCCCC